MNEHNKNDMPSTNLFISTKLSTLHILHHLILTSMPGKAGRAEERGRCYDSHSVAEGN